MRSISLSLAVALWSCSCIALAQQAPGSNYAVFPVTTDLQRYWLRGEKSIEPKVVVLIDGPSLIRADNTVDFEAIDPAHLANQMRPHRDPNNGGGAHFYVYDGRASPSRRTTEWVHNALEGFGKRQGFRE